MSMYTWKHLKTKNENVLEVKTITILITSLWCTYFINVNKRIMDDIYDHGFLRVSKYF